MSGTLIPRPDIFLEQRVPVRRNIRRSRTRRAVMEREARLLQGAVELVETAIC